MPPRLAVVFGTRPEAIKLAPVVEELRRRGVDPTIISTGQHTSLLRGTPAESTMAPHVSLNLPSDNDPHDYAITCGAALSAHWTADKPDVAMVQGDTASAYAGAWAARERTIRVVHVEAGIRSGDEADPWPEEEFRVWIDEIAYWRLCATVSNRRNLDREDGNYFDKNDMTTYTRRAANNRTWVTGNSGIDALYAHTQPTTDVVDRVLITLHRRESFGEPLLRIVQGIWAGAHKHSGLAFAWRTHPNPRVQEAAGALPYIPNVVTFPPSHSVDFARELSTCRAVITDSGGVQEEACALGIPCIVAREKTDRPESVEAGLAKVVGRTEQGILDGLDWALGFAKRPDPSHCFGDGHAAPRIVDHLLNGTP